MKIREKLVKTRRRTTRLNISNYRKILREKIEFEYYIFNVFLIAATCILLNNSASFQHFSFKLGQIVEQSNAFMETNKKILGKINTQRCSVTLKKTNGTWKHHVNLLLQSFRSVSLHLDEDAGRLAESLLQDVRFLTTSNKLA